MDIQHPNNENGAAVLLFTVLILTAILAITMTIVVITLAEMRMSESARQSTPGYFAAESGIEKALYSIRILGDRPTPSLESPYLTGNILGGKGYYEVYIMDTDPDLVMKSIGGFLNVRRAVEITFYAAGW